MTKTHDNAQDVTFFYISDGKKEGPVSKEDLLHLKEINTISASTLIWTKSYGSDWQEFGKTDEMRGDNAPPPVPVGSISMTWLVLLIMAPLILMLGELVLADNMNGFDENSIIYTYWIVNTFLAVMDERTLKRADHFETPKGLIFWAIFLVPVYIFIRGRRTGLNVWPFLAWIVSFTVSLIAIEPLRGSLYLGLSLPTCDAPISQTQIRSLYSQIPITLGAEVSLMKDIREVSEGTQSRTCTATIINSRAQENQISYTITEQGDEYYFEVNISSF